MKIYVDFKPTDHKTTKKFIITAAFGTVGDNSYILTLKKTGVE